MSLPPVPMPAPAPSGGRWIAVVALLVSLLAAGAAGWALFKPEPKPAAVAAPENPKAQACEAFYLVSTGVALQTKTDLGPEPAALQAVAANARLAMASGAVYLRDKLPANTPAEVADPMRKFADQLQTLAQYYLAGDKNDSPGQAARLADVEKTTQELIKLCK